jgi:16S rRNA G966 N2-methylase RsmD
VELSNFIYALGIEGVGKKTAKDLAKKYKNIENLITASEEELLLIPEIGEIIAKNIATCGIKNAAVSSLDYKKSLQNLNEIQKSFDIIFVDPPYATDCYYEILDYLIENKMLKENAALVLESNKELLLEKYEELFDIKVKKYGYTIVSILKLK